MWRTQDLLHSEGGVGISGSSLALADVLNKGGMKPADELCVNMVIKKKVP